MNIKKKNTKAVLWNYQIIIIIKVNISINYRLGTFIQKSKLEYIEDFNQKQYLLYLIKKKLELDIFFWILNLNSKNKAENYL